MRIINLIENTRGASGCLCEHGLSVYIETERHTILADTGASDQFARNAEKLGVSLKKVDLCFLSHGHFDHSGGILTFAKINPDAEILMSRLAEQDFFHSDARETRYIGVDRNILALPQVRLLDGDTVIDEELSVFTGVTGRAFYNRGNDLLKVRCGGKLCPDSFSHEQYLVIRSEGKTILVSGCAHNGVVNILEAFRERYGGWPDIMISGFHMYKEREEDYTEEDFANVRATAEWLSDKPVVFYTGHCTGTVPFEIMKPVLGEKLIYMHSGDVVM